MAYSDNFPQRPVFMADFANGGRIDPRATFTRSDTPPTYAAPSAVHFWSNEKHLSSENLILQSQNFGTTWGTSPTVGSRDSSSGTAPDGSDSWLQTAATSGSAWPSFNQSFGFKASTQYTYSVHVKAGTATHAWFAARGDSSTAVTGTLDFSSPGSIATTSVGGWTVDSSSVTAHGDWYRVSITFTTNSTLTAPFVYVGLSDGTVPATYFPTGTPNGETLYIWGAQIEERSSATDYNATTTQIHREYAPTLKSVAAAGQPRFEYDPASDGQSMGILIEGQSTNLYGNSLDMTGVAGTRTNIDSNVAVGPTGELTADALRLNDTDSNTHYREYSFTAAASTTYTFSVYLKAAGLSHAALRSNNLFSAEWVYFNLSNGTVEGSPALSNSMTSAGNGWYRCSVTATTTGSGAGSFVIYITDSASTTTVATGDSYRAILGQAIQIEAGSHPSSFIETSGGSTATRALESLSVATADIPGFSEGVGTIVCETGGVASSTATNQLAFGLRADSSNFFSAGVNNGGVTDASVRVYVKTSDGDQAFLNAGTATVGTGYKLACRFKLDNIAASMNGGAVVSDTSGKVPVGVDTLWVGQLAGNYYLNSSIKRVAIYNEALSDTNLQALTS